MFELAHFLILFGFFAAAFILSDDVTGRRVLNQTSGLAIISFYLYAMVAILPNLAVAVRRMHDSNRSGKGLLLLLIPPIGQLVLIVALTQRGTVGDNKYGPDPRYE
jgi:uncharacterized membrane protein YhaH (DUF805 family)